MRSALDMMTGASSLENIRDFNLDRKKMSPASKLHERYTRAREENIRNWKDEPYVSLLGAAAKAAGLKDVSMRELKTEIEDDYIEENTNDEDRDRVNRLRILRIDRFDWAKRTENSVAENVKQETM